jgi:ABC-2 type transport system ATP-binding protein
MGTQPASIRGFYMSECILRTSGLTRSFGDVCAVDHLTIDVQPGEIFGFLGPNGAGKTTTIHLLLGLLEPTDGMAEVLGHDAYRQGADVRERAGALLEDTGLYEQLTAAENLEFYARVWRLGPSERTERIRELLDWVGLFDRRMDRVCTWSRGMKQKLALARALLHHPPLVFLDEPTAGLDVVAATDVREKLKELAPKDGTTVFLTTHNMQEAERLCGRVAIICEGRLLALDKPEAIIAAVGAEDMEAAFLALLKRGGAS